MTTDQRSRISLALAILLLASACGGVEEATRTPATAATPSPAPPQQPTVTSNIAYTVGKHLDVYAPSGPGPWPVVVVVHGILQSRGEFALLAEATASEGAVVFNIDVTMAPPFLTAIEQIACAVRFARATAADHGGDPTRITLVGNSSGAHTGAVVAMAGDEFEGDCLVTDGSALTEALVGYEGTYDVATHVYGDVNLPPLEQEDPELWQAINTYSHIGGNPDLVVRLIHGEDVDDIWYETLPETSVDFHDALLDAGYDVELTLLEGATHGDLLFRTEAFEVTVQQVLEVARG